MEKVTETQGVGEEHSSPNRPSSASERLHSITPTIEAIRTLFQAPSFSVGVLHHGEVIFTKGFGLADREKGRVPDENTVYAIASCTKGFSGTALSLLAEQGKLDLDGAVSKYITSLNTVNSPDVGHMMTVRDMLSHCSGLSPLPYEVIGRMGAVFALHKDIVRICNHLPQQAKFRSEWRYNNWLFALAGVLIAQESGGSFGHFVKQEIFQNLGMKRSYLSHQTDDNFARAYLVYDDGGVDEANLPSLSDGDAFDSSGSIRSCVNDLLIWARALMNAWRASHEIKKGDATKHRSCPSLFESCIKPRISKVNPYSILPGEKTLGNGLPAPKLVASLAAAQMPHFALASDPKQAYALGLFSFQFPTAEINIVTNADVIKTHYEIGADSPKKAVVGHTGELGGFLCAYWTFPEDDSAVVVLCNSFQINGDPTNIVAQLLTQALFDLQPKVDFIAVANEIVSNAKDRWTTAEMEWKSHRVSGTSPKALKAYVGSYVNAGLAMNLDISVLEGSKSSSGENFSLRLNINGIEEQTFDLYHYHNDTWTFFPKSRNECIKLGYAAYIYSWEAFILEFRDSRDDYFRNIHWRLDPDPRVEPQCFELQST